MAVGLLGCFMLQGAGTTDDPVNDHIASQTSLNQEGFHDADQESMRIGISLGMVICISSLIVFFAALTFLSIYYP